jgi:transposase
MKMKVQERVMVVTLRIKGTKCKEIREKFERIFNKPGPADKTIRDLQNKFKRTGSVHDEPRSGRPSVSEHVVNAVRNVIHEQPCMSIRTASRRLGLPNATVHKILKSHLHMKSYHLQLSHDLHEEDYQQRSGMCADLVERIQTEFNEPHSLQ